VCSSDLHDRVEAGLLAPLASRTSLARDRSPDRVEAGLLAPLASRTSLARDRSPDGMRTKLIKITWIVTRCPYVVIKKLTGF
jgi:hypothetical protein